MNQENNMRLLPEGDSPRTRRLEMRNRKRSATLEAPYLSHRIAGTRDRNPTGRGMLLDEKK